jgi:regulator of sirC expression with transglutaminase-like and TPR domain
MSVYDQFRVLLLDEAVLPLDRAFGLVAEAVTGRGGETVTLLDTLAENVSQKDPEGVMEFLFGSRMVVGDGVSYDDPANSFVHSVLERGVGIPLTMSVIAIEVGRRVGVHLHPVGMPGHFLVASAEQAGLYFDPYNGGGSLDASACRTLYHRTTGLDTWESSYLRPIANRVVLARMLNNLKSSYRRREQYGPLRSVMMLRAMFPEFGVREAGEFARLMRGLN